MNCSKLGLRFNSCVELLNSRYCYSVFGQQELDKIHPIVSMVGRGFSKPTQKLGEKKKEVSAESNFFKCYSVAMRSIGSQTDFAIMDLEKLKMEKEEAEKRYNDLIADIECSMNSILKVK